MKTRWERLLDALADETLSADLRTGVMNEMRVLHGLPPFGHGMTYHFMIAQESVRRYHETWG